jgi:DNA-binding transcriptional LysR family regulator
MMGCNFFVSILSMDSIQAIRLFIRVVDLGSFSKAAVDLGISQPTTTKQVARIEKQLGARLLYRSTHGVKPTEIGEIYYKKCLLILHHFDEATTTATNLQSEVRGVLRISSSVGFGTRVLTNFVIRFMEMHPSLLIDLILEDQLVDLVEAGIDVAIRLGPLADSTLGARFLGINPWVVIASHEYLERKGVPSNPRNLAEHCALIYTTVQRDARWHFVGLDGSRVTVPVMGCLRSNSLTALLEAAKNGMGVAILPRYVADEALGQGLVKALLNGWSVPAQEIHAVYPSPSLVPAKVSYFVDWLQSRFDMEWCVRTK